MTGAYLYVTGPCRLRALYTLCEGKEAVFFFFLIQLS